GCGAEVGARRGVSASRGVARGTEVAHQAPVSTHASAAETTRAWRAGSRSTRLASALGVDQEQRLAVLDGLPVVDENLGDAPAHLGLDLVHELHRLDDAED